MPAHSGDDSLQAKAEFVRLDRRRILDRRSFQPEFADAFGSRTFKGAKAGARQSSLGLDDRCCDRRILMSDHDDHPKFPRRDFLRSTGSGLALAGSPWAIRSAIARIEGEPAPPGARIAKLRIYPPIGICRVGGSREWFYAPEAPGAPPRPEGGDFKDAAGKIKKQAQRFRLYAFDSSDKIICEITHQNAQISWSVHLANTKAAWYEFSNPLDNGDLDPGLPTEKRNRRIRSDRERERRLVIDGGVVSIHGRSTNAKGVDPRYAIEGAFWGAEKVRLGHLRTDPEGRLIVMPPDGISRSPMHQAITSITDNDGWYDDWSDGPIGAAVTFGSRRLEAEPAWVACVGPDFAPEIAPITTMYDLISDLNARQGWVAEPVRPLSYMRFIHPVFHRTALAQWVTRSGYLTTRWLAPDIDFADPSFMARLADPTEGNAAFRKHVLTMFRDPEETGGDAFIKQQNKLPYMLGDGVDDYGSPLQWFQLPKQQFGFLKSWARGEFVDDRARYENPPRGQIEDYPLAQQPALLTEAALEKLSGGAFHPGVELTGYLRQSPMYQRHYAPDAEPFRIAHRQRTRIVQDLGRKLSPKKLLNGFGPTPSPIGPQMAGDLTRWMAVPWQSELLACQQVMLQEDFPSAAWWPAQAPNDVLTEGDYRRLMNPALTTEERRKSFDTRVSWWRDVAGVGYADPAASFTSLIATWEKLGFVVKRPAPRDPGAPSGFPEDIFVEMGHTDRSGFDIDVEAPARATRD